MEITLTERESDIMAVLWERGPSTVAEVREQLSDELAYNTVLTMLRILEEKGYAGHEEEGRAYRYHALVEREAAAESAIRDLVRRLFGGSPSQLVTQLVRERELPEEELRRLRELIDARLAGGGEEAG
ncbi:MAG: BlaI/MecI/CopY family transcriptional regulator [Longimicrobiales bacterium]|nr:BlaI/MecI/CopY family transcriptional regulator [Longimicrobiales bacterium]